MYMHTYVHICTYVYTYVLSLTLLHVHVSRGDPMGVNNLYGRWLLLETSSSSSAATDRPPVALHVRTGPMGFPLFLSPNQLDNTLWLLLIAPD